MSYQEYITSREWGTKRAMAISRAKHRCGKCNRRSELHVHHKTYKNLGFEKPEDLVVLCVRCHNDLHYMDYKTLADIKMIANITPITEEEYNQKVLEVAI